MKRRDRGRKLLRQATTTTTVADAGPTASAGRRRVLLLAVLFAAAVLVAFLAYRAFREAEVEIAKEGDSGVLATIGSRFGGWGLLIMDGKPRFDYAFSNQAKHRWQIAAPDKLAVRQAHHRA